MQRYKQQMGERMGVVVGTTATDLDGRFATCACWRRQPLLIGFGLILASLHACG